MIGSCVKQNCHGIQALAKLAASLSSARFKASLFAGAHGNEVLEANGNFLWPKRVRDGIPRREKLIKAGLGIHSARRKNITHIVRQQVGGIRAGFDPSAALAYEVASEVTRAENEKQKYPGGRA